MMRVAIDFTAGSSAGCPACADPVVLQERVRGTREPHKLAQGGSTPPPATILSPGNPVTAPALPSWESLGDRIAQCTREVRELREKRENEAKRMEQTRKDNLWKSPLTIS